MRLFEAKLPRVPRYRQVVRATPFQLLRPVWADDQEFAIRHHVRHASVRALGGPEQLESVPDLDSSPQASAAPWPNSARASRAGDLRL
jgi:diacylglycerol O-acyltransferase / wax synthase